MVIFLLRHADKKPVPADGLTAAGFERAKLLARMLDESGVSIAYCSDAARAHQTLEPLNQKLGGALTIEEVEIKDHPGGPEAHVKTIVQAITALPGKTVAAVVSHSNTVGPIIEGLKGGTVEPIGDNEFDKLFVLFIDPAGSASLLKLRYGAPT